MTGGVIRFSCEGDPRGQGRPRTQLVRTKRGQTFAHIYKDDLDTAYEESIAQIAVENMRARFGGIFTSNLMNVPSDDIARLLRAAEKDRPKYIRRLRLSPREAKAVFDEWRLINEPLYLDVRFRISPPKSMSKKERAAILNGEVPYLGRYDCSNMLKAVEDALNHICWVDDRQIIDAHASKRAAEQPGIDICITPLSEVDGSIPLPHMTLMR